MSKDYNELVDFLIGRWDNTSFEVSDGNSIKREDYPETMVGKDQHTITITAHGFKDGNDLTKDIRLEINGNTIVMSQGSFRAEEQRR